MHDTASNNKRIVKNTAMLYARMFLVLGISLYTSRVILDALGVIDFGIYNVVAGVTGMLLFFTSSLSNASQRFISFEIGKKDYDSANKVFNLSLELYGIISVFLFIALESVGLWLVNDKLVIPAERMIAANYIFQFTVVSAILTVLQVPYQSVIIAEERMGIYAYMGIYNAIMKLIIVYLITITQDRLIAYGAMFMLVELSCSLFYVYYCKKNFAICKLKFYWNKLKARELFSFISYTAYGCISWSLAYQGASILLNLFFGPAINAARGIAMQINGSLTNFSSAIVTAIKPQIIKSYAANDLEQMHKLIIFSSKYTLLLFVFLSFLLFVNIDFILSIWLKDVPDYTNSFACLIIVDSIIASLLNPIGIAINATGKLRNMQVYGRTITLMALPISYFLYKFNLILSPNGVFWILIFAEIGYWLYCFHDMHRQIKLSYFDYFSKVVFPIGKVIILSLFAIYGMSYFPFEGWQRFFIVTFLLFIIIIASSVVTVLTKNEKRFIVNYIKSR